LTISRQYRVQYPQVVAVLGPSDLEYLATILGSSVSAYILLLEKCHCDLMLYSQSYESKINDILRLRQMALVPMLSRCDFNSELGNSEPFIRIVDKPLASKATAFIMHSSGSSGTPKPIFHTHKRCLQAFRNGFPYSVLVTLPLFHAYGFSSFWRALEGRTLLYLFNWHLPLTVENVVETLRAVKPQMVSTVPYTLKLFAESPLGIEALKNCTLVTYHGSACPDELGHRLVESGIHLVGHIGS